MSHNVEFRWLVVGPYHKDANSGFINQNNNGFSGSKILQYRKSPPTGSAPGTEAEWVTVPVVYES